MTFLLDGIYCRFYRTGHFDKMKLNKLQNFGIKTK